MTFNHSRRDIAAALALAAIAIPEQIATARLAGAPPATGLLVFAAASTGFFLLGSNRYISVGADFTIAPVFAAALAGMASSTSPRNMALAALVAMMAGTLVMASGLLRMGWVSRLLSVPIITDSGRHLRSYRAFAVARITRHSIGRSRTYRPCQRAYSQHFSRQPHLSGNRIGVFAATFISEKLNRRVPAPLMALVVCALAVQFLDLAPQGVSVLGNIRRPSLVAPHVTHDDILKILPLSLLIALMIIIQTATVSRSVLSAGETGNLNRDLMGAGAGNILSGFLGGFAANSSPPRSAILREAHAASRLAGFLAALLIGALCLFGLNLLADIPVTALAGLLLFVAVRIFHFDTMRAIATKSRPEFVLAATAAVIICTPVEIGVAIGVVLSLMYGVWTIVQTQVLEFGQIPGSTVWWPMTGAFRGERQAGIVVAGFQAPLFSSIRTPFTKA